MVGSSRLTLLLAGWSCRYDTQGRNDWASFSMHRAIEKPIPSKESMGTLLFPAFFVNWSRRRVKKMRVSFVLRQLQVARTKGSSSNTVSDSKAGHHGSATSYTGAVTEPSSLTVTTLYCGGWISMICSAG